MVGPEATVNARLIDVGVSTAVLTSDAGVGAKADAAVVNPANEATVVALLKGILTQQLALKADLALVKADVAEVKAAQGTVADAAYAAGDGTVVAILKGIFGKP